MKLEIHSRQMLTVKLMNELCDRNEREEGRKKL